MEEKKDGFWIRMWMRSGRGSDVETYGFMSYELGYTETDEELLKSEVDRWCTNDLKCWAREHYRYGYDIVAKPPETWIKNRLVTLERWQKSVDNEKKRLEALLHE